MSLEETPAELQADRKVLPLELFFDLVFVFALTQVTGFIAVDATWLRLVEGMAILAVLWWAWVSYAWLANTAASDEGAVRVVLLAAMGAMLIASLAVPQAFGDDGVIFGVAYLVVRLLHLAAYVVVARDDPRLMSVVGRLASTIVPAALLLVLAGFLDGTAQGVCWAAALTLDYAGLAVRGIEGWRVHAGHFAERHGLVIIIALGESIVSIGVGVGHLDLDWELILGALLGVADVGALWWVYFDVVSLAAEHRIRSAPTDLERVRIARNTYSYLHLPMVAGIVLFALGLKETLAGVDVELEPVPATALCAGTALYLLALSLLKRMNYGSFNLPRLVAAFILIILAPFATTFSALLSLALVTAVAASLVAYEFTAYAEARDRIRHGT